MPNFQLYTDHWRISITMENKLSGYKYKIEKKKQINAHDPVEYQRNLKPKIKNILLGSLKRIEKIDLREAINKASKEVQERTYNTPPSPAQIKLSVEIKLLQGEKARILKIKEKTLSERIK